MPEGDLGYARICPYCGAGTHNGNKHSPRCLSRVVEFKTDVPYLELYDAWRRGAKARFDGTYESGAALSRGDPAAEAYEMGAACAEDAMIKGGKMENIFRSSLGGMQPVTGW